MARKHSIYSSALSLLQAVRYWAQLTLIFAISHIIMPFVSAQSEQEAQPLNCSSRTDKYSGNSQKQFTMKDWLQRGICVRAKNRDAICYETLTHVLNNLISIRAAEYNGSAGVLCLLPTIEVLLVAPTNEIWRLLTIVPFGGSLATLLSFGGAILTTKIEDYEYSINNGNKSIGSIISLRLGPTDGKPRSEVEKEETEHKVTQLMERLEKRTQQSESQHVSKTYLWVGFFGMILLFIACQAAMILIEQGGVLPWWYGLVTLTAFIENYVQLPFATSWKLLVSDIPYDIEFSDGDNIVDTSDQNGHDVERALKQLSTLKAADLLLRGRAKIATQSRNSIMIMVSVVDTQNQRVNAFWKVVSKACSIAIFITGTALFASVQLLALPMTVMVLVLVLVAGVFGRAIAAWIVTGVEKTEPLIHVIANTTGEACQIIGKILTLDKDIALHEGERNIQVEIAGHVFVGYRRVAKRSSLWVNIFGVMAHPFDLRKVSTLRSLLDEGTNASEIEGLLPRGSR